MGKPNCYKVEFIHIHSGATGTWEVYADNKAEAMIHAREMLPESDKITNVYLAPMFDD